MGNYIQCTLSSGVHFLVIWCTLSRSVLEKKTFIPTPKYKYLYIEMNIIILSLSITYIIFVKLSVKSEGRNFSFKMLIF